jgi:perosamine synthetase
MKNTWRFGEQEMNYLREVIDSGFGSGTSGSMNNRFERAFAEKVGTDWAVTFNSGTSTLHAALDAMGVGTGDEVITTPLTVISNLDVILAQNAIPVFADIDPDTFNIDPADIARKITPRTKAIMPVSLYGLPCDLDPIMALAQEAGVMVLNDAAQAFQARYHGRPIAEIAHVTSFSTENSKHITTGDGGIIATNDEALATHIRKFGSLGYTAMTSGDGRIRINKDIFQNPNYSRHDMFSYNYRMPEVAAALGLAQTERMDFFVKLRRDIAQMFLDVMAECDYLTPQKIPEGYESSWWSVAARYRREDVSWEEFRLKNIELGGDGIYAAWALLYQESVYSTGAWKKRCPPVYENLPDKDPGCPQADMLQPQLMQFVNNYGSEDEARPKVEALAKTIAFFA